MDYLKKLDLTGGNSILIVDDEAANIIALSDILGSEYSIFISKDGLGAIETAVELKPDLILLDVMMPLMDGFEVIRALKQREETSEIPVIFITGLNNREDEEKGLKLGAVDYINKPFSEDVVKLRVNNQIKVINAIRTINHLSITDTLTEVANRRHFNDKFSQEWQRAVRDATPIAILLIDIDHFKRYNDSFGHIQGDIALQTVASVIKSELKRPMDMIARWGGEEFAVIMPNTDFDGAEKVAEDIRLAVESYTIPSEEGLPTTVTVSIGISCIIPDTSSTMNRFFSVVDKALYTAKGTGRNRVVRAAE
jgi:diguanylate cyclase (GGDEF)-like protein